jgi:hypothetical protein
MKKRLEEIQKSLEDSFDEQLNLSELEKIEGGEEKDGGSINALADCGAIVNNCNGGNCVVGCGKSS